MPTNPDIDDAAFLNDWAADIDRNAGGHSVDAARLRRIAAKPSRSGDEGWRPIADAPDAEHFIAAVFADETGDWVMSIKMKRDAQRLGFTDWRPLPEPPKPYSGEDHRLNAIAALSRPAEPAQVPTEVTETRK